MRCYNENPQVTALLEKIEEQKKITKELNESIRLTIKSWQKSLEEICNEKDKLVESISHFNTLPWYKKMFYKFKI